MTWDDLALTLTGRSFPFIILEGKMTLYSLPLISVQKVTFSVAYGAYNTENRLLFDAHTQIIGVAYSKI